MERFDVKVLGVTGICSSCLDRSRCSMKQMLPIHWTMIGIHGVNYGDIDPATWSEFAIENPEFNDEGKVTWCPMYIKGRL